MERRSGEMECRAREGEKVKLEAVIVELEQQNVVPKEGADE